MYSPLRCTTPSERNDARQVSRQRFTSRADGRSLRYPRCAPYAGKNNRHAQLPNTDQTRQSGPPPYCLAWNTVPKHHRRRTLASRRLWAHTWHGRTQLDTGYNRVRCCRGSTLSCPGICSAPHAHSSKCASNEMVFRYLQTHHALVNWSGPMMALAYPSQVASSCAPPSLRERRACPSLWEMWGL